MSFMADCCGEVAESVCASLPEYTDIKKVRREKCSAEGTNTFANGQD